MRTSVFLFFVGIGIFGAALLVMGTDSMSSMQLIALATVITILIATFIGMMTVREPISARGE